MTRVRKKNTDLRLPQRVYLDSKSKTFFYHPKNGAAVKLGKDKEEALKFWAQIVYPKNPEDKKIRQEMLTPIRWIEQLYSIAKSRAKNNNRDFTITLEDLKNIAKQCDNRCMLTGIDFDFAKTDDCFRRPFTPSIDRIDSNLGYTPDNIRLVCTAVNLALNDFGLEILLKIATGLKKKGLI
jgi:hypothetical protein